MESNTLAGRTIQQSFSCRPIRVLFVIPKSQSKAFMIFSHRQVTYLKRLGIAGKKFLLASRTSPCILAREWRRLRKMIQSFQPDLIHAQYGTMTAFFAAVSAPVPLVVTYRGSDLNPSPNKPLAHWLAGRLLSQAAALWARQIICVSDELRERLWVRKHLAGVIPTGVDTESFFPRSRNEARAQLGWGNHERVVLFNAGGNPKLKRLDLAQAAVDCARTICGDIRFVVLNGDTAPESVPIIMNAADSLLVTSCFEGSPTVVQEAMACNLPVVSVDVGDVRQRLEGVRPSRIVERDPIEIGRVLAEFLIQGERSNGSSRIHAISNDIIADRTLSVYRAALRTDH